MCSLIPFFQLDPHIVVSQQHLVALQQVHLGLLRGHQFVLGQNFSQGQFNFDEGKSLANAQAGSA